MMMELTACPFCGSVANNPELSIIYEDSVLCPDCGIYTHKDKWQRRPLEDALQKRVEELERGESEIFDLLTGNIKWQRERYFSLRASIDEAVRTLQGRADESRKHATPNSLMEREATTLDLVIDILQSNGLVK